jgi:phospholipase D
MIGAAGYFGQEIARTRQVTMTGTTTVTVQSLTRPDLLEYCFSPGGTCSNVIIFWITRANSSIHILIYSFTLNSIGGALVAAKQRNPTLDIKIVWDESNWNETGSEYAKLKNTAIDIRIDHRHGLLHDKVAIIDSHIIITGSFNWSQAANEDNRENLVVLDGQGWAAAYEAQFQKIYNASTQ